MHACPDLKIEFDANHGFRNIVNDKFDAGLRLGDTINKDMIAMQISPPLRMAAVASPAYFSEMGVPESPKELVSHRCINMRMTTSGGIYVWEFEKEQKALNVRVDGQLIFTTSAPMLDAALAGHGIALLPEEEFGNNIEEGKLVRILDEWCPPFPGYFLYYPSRKQPSPVFSLVVEALRMT